MMMIAKRLHTRNTDPTLETRAWRLHIRRTRRKLLSTVAAVALLASGGVVAAVFAPPAPAEAATLGGIVTSFEIDGNTAGANDWQGVIGSTPKPPYITASGDQSTGIVTAQKSWDAGTTVGNPGVCGANLGIDDILVPSTSLNDPTWPETVGTANDKGDACTGGSAYEVVTVGGNPHTIFYAYWTRYSGSGDMSSYEVFQGPAAGRADDYLIEFNYNSGGGGSTSINVLGWNGSAWVPTGATIVYQAAVGTNTDTNTTGNAATFGEMAVDLTASGLLPSDGGCRTFLDAGFVTKTGEGGPATLKDILKSDAPITLSNCGGLTVQKVANPVDATSEDVFDYTVTRTGGGPVHDATLTGPVLPQANTNAIAAPIGVGDTHSWGNVFAGTDYQLAETVDAGQPWVHQSTVCTVTNPSTNLLETYTNEPFKLYVGANTACVITNATSGVTVTKLAEGDAADFDFILTGDRVATLSSGETSEVFGYVPGSVVTITELAEVADPAWHLIDLVCDGGTPVIDLELGTATVTTVAGTVIDCTFTNRQDGAIMIVKNVAGDDGEFDFAGDWGQGSDDFSLSTVGGTAGASYTDITPGAYSVAELTPEPEYDLTAIVCTDDAPNGVGSTADLALGAGTINLDPGELVVCTFTNTQRGTIIVDKVTSPADSPVSFGFSLDGPETDTDFSLTDDAAPFESGLVPAGQYTLGETAVPGWELTNMHCGDAGTSPTSPIVFTLEPGATVVCTVLNTATAGRVTVTKLVEGVPTGYDWSFPISITPVPQGQLGTLDVTDDVPSVGWTDLDVGVEYTLVEPQVDGWLSGEFSCTGLIDGNDQAAGFQFTVTPGLELSCTITNVVVPGRVLVEKTVSGVGEGADWSFDITIDPVPGAQPATRAVTDDDPIVEWTELAIGTVYTLTETLPAGWEGGVVTCTGLQDHSVDAGFQFVSTPGLELECDVTNRAIPAEAEITKTSIGEDGSFTFVLTPEGGEPVEQIITTVDGTGTTAFEQLQPGVTYQLEESDPGEHWIAGALECTVEHADATSEPLDPASFTVEAGDGITCAIVNTAKGTIVIVKHVEGADGTFDFTGTWPGIGNFEITTVAGTGSDTSTDVPSGSYSVTELLTSQYIGSLVSCTDSDEGGVASSISGVVGTIELDPGETVTCTYSNTERGEIIVDKVVPGTSQHAFDFELRGGATSDFSLTDDDDPFESGLLDPGTSYTVEELATANWTLDDLICTGGADVTYEGSTATIDLNPGEVVTCTFTNTPNPGEVVVEKVVQGVPEGWNFSFDITISPEVAGQPATQTVTDEDPNVAWVELVVGETYTLAESASDGWTEGPIVCVGLVDAELALAGFQFEVTPGLELECSVTNTAEPGSVDVTKIVSGPIGDIEWSFDVTIDPVPDGQDATQAVTDADPSVGWTDLEIGTVYTLTEVLPEGWTGGVFTCVGLQDLSGDAGYQFMATPGLELDCTVENLVAPPTGLIDKVVDSTEQLPDGTWEIAYTVTVTNQSVVLPLVYDLSDAPQFGAGIVINTATATGPAGSLVADWDPVGGDFVLAADQQLAASGVDEYEITINATVPGVVYETGTEVCSPDDELDDGGFRNTAYLVVGDGEPQPASDCSEPGRATIDKELGGLPQNLGNGEWEVVYTVTVTSESELPLYYDLEDDLGFPAGVTIVTATATNDAGVDTAAWNGDGVTALADDEQIDPLAVHVYTITVVADVADITVIDTVRCVAETSGNGFFNEAALVSGTITSTDEACAPIPVGRLRLDKLVDNSAFDGLDLDGNTLLEAGDWLLSGIGADQSVSVLGDEGIEFTVSVGDYALAEELSADGASNPLAPFYVDGEWSCDDEVSDDANAAVVLGALTSCEIVNTGHPVDLAIVKQDVEEIDDVPSVPTDVSSQYQYTFTVENNGEIAAPNAVVTDEIPDTIAVDTATWEIPAGWTAELTGAVGGFGGTLVLTKETPFLVDEAFVFTFWVTTAAELPREDGNASGRILDIVNTAVIDSDGLEATPGDNTSTETTPVKSVEVNASAICRNNTPIMSYEITPFNIENVDPLTIVLIWWTPEAFANRDASIPASDTAAILADGASQVDAIVPPAFVASGETLSGDLLWPGAAVDENGDPIAWPGWRLLASGEWILDPSAPFSDLRGSAVVEVRLNPSTDSIQTYPPASPNCNATPPGFTPPPRPAAMARTGVDSGQLLWGAVGLVLVGGVLFAAYLIRRRRTVGDAD